VYTALVGHPRASLAELTAAVALAEPEVRCAVIALHTAGLATRRDDVTPHTWEAEPPDRAIDDVLDAEAARLNVARRTSQQLSRLYWLTRRETSRYPGLEVLRDPAQVREQYRLIMDLAQHDVLTCNRPPFLTAAEPAAVDAQVELQDRSMRSGVVHKAIWWEGLFDDPVASAVAETGMANGEQTRILADVPLKLVIGDDQRAMLPLDPTDLTDGATLVIHPSGLLTALISIFDTLWTLATPISSARSADLTERERTILTLMVAGATDDVIARRLGTSRRTIIRHTANLFDRLGAKTRFQAGAQAVRRGWI
jgi:DNA-binding CsgD family transcriptional regulator